jgi:pSer/pThr/pTyr-binding forkhead associated (FHA) protein
MSPPESSTTATAVTRPAPWPPAGTRVLDDRSLNGIVVGGVRVSAATLRDGDVIELGRVRLHYLRRR